MTRLIHFSDTHGSIPYLDQLETIDVVVHSGDLHPNWSRGILPIERSRQLAWSIAEAPRMADNWGTNQPFLYCGGNHDYSDPVPAMRAAGMDAYNIENRVVEAAGLRFYGFPYVKYWSGEWNGEVGESELARMLQPISEMIESGEIDILVAHGPYYGCLDRNGYGERCGSKSLRQMIFGLTRPLKALLTGHIHEGEGINMYHKMIVSNAAQISRLITL